MVKKSLIKILKILIFVVRLYKTIFRRKVRKRLCYVRSKNSIKRDILEKRRDLKSRIRALKRAGASYQEISRMLSGRKI